MQRISIALFCCMTVFVTALRAAEIPDQSKVEALVRKLGDESFSVRKRAYKELKALIRYTVAEDIDPTPRRSSTNTLMKKEEPFSIGSETRRLVVTIPFSTIIVIAAGHRDIRRKSRGLFIK